MSGRRDGAGRGGAERLRRLMGEAEALARLEREKVVVTGRRKGVSLVLGSLPAAALRDLQAAGAAEPVPEEPGAFRLSEAGRAALRRAGSAPQSAFADQHRSRALRHVAGEGGAERLTVNERESPLAWLARRRGPDSRPLLAPEAFEAGERLRRDLTLAGSLPALGIDWQALAAGRGPGGGNLLPSEAAAAARQRVERALAAVTPEFAGILVDVCGFLKSIETVEQERRWPARSAKVVLGLALAALARHYGLSGLARGPERSRGLRAWRA